MNDADRGTETHSARPIDDETAATSIEYALIASLISIMIVAAATIVGVKLTALYDTVASILP